MDILKITGFVGCIRRIDFIQQNQAGGFQLIIEEPAENLTCFPKIGIQDSDNFFKFHNPGQQWISQEWNFDLEFGSKIPAIRLWLFCKPGENCFLPVENRGGQDPWHEKMG